MRNYFIRRFIAIIPMFFLMTATYFCIQNYLPGGPVQEALARLKGVGGEGGSAKTLNAEDLQKLTQELQVEYGLDKPAVTRYFIWIKNVFTLNFGDSITTRAPAIEQIIERLPISLSFGIPGFFLTYLIAIPLGVYMALRDGSRFDVISSFVLFVTYSIPSIVFAVIFLLIFCTDRILPGGAWFPLGGFRSDNYENLSNIEKLIDLGKHLFLPVLASIIGNFTVYALLQKNSMLEVIRSDYIRTARAKGLSENAVVFKHALRNALLPLMVGFGAVLGTFLGGSIIIEPIFGLPGIGVLSLQSLAARDFNVIMAIVVLQSLAILFGQILNDVVYVIVDPRIEYK
ncbi:ABC transporter permease [Fluviispira multicolorata]|uniref:ABC transporter permease subunit n=1 Tax=Fluviispira multicolorata TaxID=2654512 RepID=A0A833JBP9_9BACT|nr:ABC transporter permease [Fluviispira multicolorata]KAB8029771.1 ABC transporter permease subunit [Fluviispira multicolorata]